MSYTPVGSFWQVVYNLFWDFTIPILFGIVLRYDLLKERAKLRHMKKALIACGLYDMEK